MCLIPSTLGHLKGFTLHSKESGKTGSQLRIKYRNFNECIQLHTNFIWWLCAINTLSEKNIIITYYEYNTMWYNNVLCM